jgi:multiple sugar transport system permease protein
MQLTAQGKAAPAAPAPRTSSRPQPGLLKRMANHWADYIYILPAIAVMVLVIGYPVVYTIWLSFHDTDNRTGIEAWNGIGSYTDVLTNDRLRFVQTTKNTFVWTIGSTVGAFILGFGAALVLHKKFVGRGVIRAILLIPYVISAVAAAYVWKWMLHSDYGLVSGALKDWGVMDNNLVLLDNKDRVLPTVIIVNIWKEFSFVMIMMIAGLQTVPGQLLRAARVDGASAWQSFWHVTVPHLKNVILITTLLLFVANLNSFTLVFLMTGGGPANASQLWITQIYNIAFRSQEYGLASAYSVILFLVMLAAGWYYVRILTQGGSKRSAA